MKIVIFGSTGKLGQLLARKALADGHEVTAFSRSRDTLPFWHEHLRLAYGDIYQPGTVATAILGQQAVLSTLGMNFFGRRPVCTDGMKAIIPAMHDAGIRRLIAISAFGANEDRSFNFYTKHLRWVIKYHMADKDMMEREIEASKLDWTIIRPATYFDFWPDNNYVIEEKLRRSYPFSTRRAVADFMLRVLKSGEYVRQKPAIRCGQS